MDPEENDTVNPPDLLPFSGDWELYEETLYGIFSETILKSPPTFKGVHVGVQRLPEYKNKHFAFWHLISEGEKEEERTPDFRRCERLRWVKWVIENSNSSAEISVWESKRKRSLNVVLWYEKGEYAVILAKRNGYYLIKTAYTVSERRARVFRTERESYSKLTK